MAEVAAAAAAGCGCFWPSGDCALPLPIDGGGQFSAAAIRRRRRRRANGQTARHLNFKVNLYYK